MVELDQAGRGRALVRVRQPPAPLTPWVEHIALHPRVPAAAGAQSWRIVADANAHIIVTRGRDPNGPVRATLVGARSRHVDTNMATRAWTLCVRLRAGAIPALTGMPARELTDASRRIEELPIVGGDALLQDLGQVRTAGASARVLLRFLGARLHGADAATFRAARLLDLLRGTGAHSVRALARDLGLAERTLHHLCVTTVGLGPRRIARILRLHGALGAAISGAGNWARIAAAHDYADQSHLIRDFKDLLGEPPVEFLRRGAAA